MAKESNINVDVNKGLASVAALGAAISFGFGAVVFGWMHPAAAAGVAGFVAYGAAWINGKLGMAAIAISAIVFLAAYHA